VTAEVEWRPAERPGILLSSDVGGSLPISEEVARRLVGGRSGILNVRLRHDLPVGQGFGTSAAGALATALAVAEVLRRPRSKAIEVAHLADLFGRGGLGGVAAILGGGLEVRTRAGLPPLGRVVHRSYTDSIFVGVVGSPILSPRALANPAILHRIEEVGREIDDLARHPDSHRFWGASERFTDRVPLAPPRVRTVLRALRRRGARAAQAMFGSSFFAALPRGDRRRELLRWASRRGLRAVELNAAHRGARRLPPEP
jgi:pantoate kinase